MEPPKLKLPTEKQQPSKEWTRQKSLMIGPGKVGKSSFWAQGEKTLFLATEPGLTHLACLQVPIRSWEEAREVYSLLLAATPFPYDTLVVDTIDKLIALSHEEAVMRAREKFSKIAGEIHTIGDIPEGVGWYWSSNMIDMFLAKLKEFPAHLVLIGHVQTKEIKEPTRKYDKETINVGGQMGTKLLHWADHTLHVQARYTGERLERVIRTLPSQTLEAGSRGRVVPDGMRWGEDDAANYAAFRKLFD